MGRRIVSKFYIFWVALTTLITGCTTLDSAISPMGVITQDVSQMDNMRSVHMSPVIGKSGLSEPDNTFGLYWDSSKGKKAFLVLSVGHITNLSGKSPFEIKVDGKMIKLPPVDKNNYGITEGLRTEKDYVVSKEQILEISNAQEAFYRIHYLDNTFSEGEISYKYRNYQSYVPFSFLRFYREVWGEN